MPLSSRDVLRIPGDRAKLTAEQRLSTARAVRSARRPEVLGAAELTLALVADSESRGGLYDRADGA